MVKRCQWGQCNSDSRYPERLEGGVTFIPFPKPKRKLEKCKRWIKACGRSHEQLNPSVINGNYHMFVCTKHFPEGRPTERYPDPVQAPLGPPSKRRMVSEPVMMKRKILLESNQSEDVNVRQTSVQNLSLTESCSPATSTSRVVKEDEDTRSGDDQDFLIKITEKTEQFVTKEVAKLMIEMKDLKKKVGDYETRLSTMEKESAQLKKEVKALKVDNAVLSTKVIKINQTQGRGCVEVVHGAFTAALNSLMLPSMQTETMAVPQTLPMSQTFQSPSCDTQNEPISVTSSSRKRKRTPSPTALIFTKLEDMRDRIKEDNSGILNGIQLA